MSRILEKLKDPYQTILVFGTDDIPIWLNVIATYLVTLFLPLLSSIVFIIIFPISVFEPLFVWLWKKCNITYFKTRKEKKRIKNIELIMYNYESNILRSNGVYNLVWYIHNQMESYEHDKNIEFKDFLKLFFIELNNSCYTYNNIAEYVCNGRRRRSLGDIYLICKNYYPDCTLKDVVKTLIELINEKVIVGSYCTTINKYVFHNQSRTHTPNDRTEYNKYALLGDRELTFNDIINYYKTVK